MYRPCNGNKGGQLYPVTPHGPTAPQVYVALLSSNADWCMASGLLTVRGRLTDDAHIHNIMTGPSKQSHHAQRPTLSCRLQPAIAHFMTSAFARRPNLLHFCIGTRLLALNLQRLFFWKHTQSYDRSPVNKYIFACALHRQICHKKPSCCWDGLPFS